MRHGYSIIISLNNHLSGEWDATLCVSKLLAFELLREMWLPPSSVVV